MSLDWLQVNLRPKHDHEGKFHSFYQVETLPNGTRHFRCVQEIFQHGVRIATCVSKPYSPVIDEKTHLIKFDNHILYQENVYEWIYRFLVLNSFEFKGISRLDISCDFHLFANGGHPEKFIKGYCTEKILKLGKSNFNVRGRQQWKNTFEYLRFGTNTSEISYYIYNKTQELKNVKDKPYIRDCWLKNGFDVNKDVWRLEFTIKSAQKVVINEGTGEQIDLKFLDVLKRENFARLFNTLLQNYFQFVKNDRTRNKSRMKHLKLFNLKTHEGDTLKEVTGKRDSGRSEKIFVKKLSQLNDELRGTDFETSIACNDILYNYIEKRGLESWCMRKNLMPVVPAKKNKP